jgi:hypothetical protein
LKGTCGSQEWAYGDNGEVIVYGTCGREPFHEGRHVEYADEGRPIAGWSDLYWRRAPTEWEPRAAELAQALLDIAETAMPSTYFATDSRCQMARQTLEVLGYVDDEE